jgi:hypothetical protein
MHSHRRQNLIGRAGEWGGLPRRSLLQSGGALGLAAILRPTAVTGALGALMRPGVVFAKNQRQLGPFSDWSEPVNLGPVVNSGFNEIHPGISRDGLSLYITSDRPGGVNGDNLNGIYELWVSQREDLDAPWEPPLSLGPNINVRGYGSGVPNLTPNGDRLFFGSIRPGGCAGTAGNLWVAEREDPEDDLAWEAPMNLGCAINKSDEDSPVYFRDRQNGITTLYYTRFDGPGGSFGTPDQDWNIYVSTLGEDGAFGPGVPVPELNSPFRDTRMAIRSDGLEMIFTSSRPGGIGPAGKLTLNLWVSTRASTRDRWSTPVNLGRPVNSGAGDRGPALSFDGKTLYFSSARPAGSGKLDVWMATRTKLERDD